MLWSLGLLVAVRVETRVPSPAARVLKCFVIKILVLKYILLFLLGRPPTFLAEEVLGSADLCQEFLAFIIHVKTNVLSCCDLAGFGVLPPRPTESSCCSVMRTVSPKVSPLSSGLCEEQGGGLRALCLLARGWGPGDRACALYGFPSPLASSRNSWF